jgi:hypothetical protein
LPEVARVASRLHTALLERSVPADAAGGAGAALLAP